MIKNWKLEITENETKLIADGILESFDIMSLVAELEDEFDVKIKPKDLVAENFNSVDLVIKYHLNKLPVYHENGNKYFDYTLKEDTKYKNDNLPIKPFKKVTDSNFSYFLKKAEDLIHESGYVDQLYGIDFVFDVPKRQGNFADCLLCIDFLDIDEETERPSELYQFDLMELKWVKKKKKQRSWKDIMITNINWSTPDDVRVMAGLPDEIYASVLNINFSKYDPDDDLDYNEDFLDDVSDALTNKYGFCHDGFKIKIRRKENE